MNIEFYLRYSTIKVCFLVLLVWMFEYLAKKYLLYSFLANSMSIVYLNIFVFLYFKKWQEKIIVFLCKRQFFSFFNILIIMFLLIGITIFIINQTFIKYLDFINLLPKTTSIINNQTLINTLSLFNNPKHLEILFIGLNFILIINAINDFMIKKIYCNKLSNLYLSSLVFPVFYSVVIHYFKLNNLIIPELLSTDLFNFMMLFVVIHMFNVDYKKIHHLLCFFNFNTIKNNILEKTKIIYAKSINKLIIAFWVMLIFYYNFIYIPIESLVGMGAILGLFIIIALISKIFWLLNRYFLGQLYI